MGVEIWKGVCSGKLDSYDTEVLGFRDSNAVQIIQNDDPDEHHRSIVVMDEAQAIDIALCILRELAPGFYQALGEKQ